MSYTGSKLTRVRATLPVLLAIELGIRYHMCDLHSKFEEDRTKPVSIVNELYCGQTDTHIDRHTLEWFYICLHNAVITCEIKLFQNDFDLR